MPHRPNVLVDTAPVRVRYPRRLHTLDRIMTTDPTRPTDNEARALARRLIDEATYAALGVVDAGRPMVTRVAVATDEAGIPITLISDLSQHTKCLRENPEVSLLLGEPGPRGDPLNHPRLTLSAIASFADKSTKLVDRYLAHQPKAKLYIGFADFHIVRLTPTGGHLNGGFGKAFRLSARDLEPDA